MAELGDKIDATTKTEVENAVNNLKRAMESEDTVEIKRLTEALTQASHSLAASMYQDASSAGAQQSGGGESAWHQPTTGSDDDVVDAEFQEVA